MASKRFGVLVPLEDTSKALSERHGFSQLVLWGVLSEADELIPRIEPVQRLMKNKKRCSPSAAHAEHGTRITLP